MKILNYSKISSNISRVWPSNK